VVALLVTAVVSLPAVASAHATLVSTTPTDGSHLDDGPAEIVFTLDEPVSLVQGSAAVIDQDGTRHEVEGTDLGAGGSVVTVRLAQPLPDGSFLATARLLSLDTHVVSVSATFTVGAAEGLLPVPDVQATSTASRIVSYLAKLAVYVGAVASAGVLTTTARLWPGRRHGVRWRATLRWGSALLVVGLVVRLGVEAAHRAGGPTRVSGDVLVDLLTVNGAFAVTALVAAAVTVVAAHLVLRTGDGPPLGVVAGVTAATTALAVSLGGHGADPALFPLPLVLTVVHVYAVLAWLGGVLTIAVELGRPPDLERWHRYALFHLVLAAASGAGLALLRVPAPAALVGTTYGLSLVVKTVLVAAAVGVAGLVHRRLARTTRRPAGARLLGTEIALVLTVLGTTGVLSSAVPATVSHDPPVRTAMDFGGDARLDVAIPSTRRGAQTLVVETSARAGAAVPALSVDLSSEQAEVARLPVRFDDVEQTGDVLRWRSRDLVVPVTGRWKVTVTFDTPAGPRVASFHYDVL